MFKKGSNRPVSHLQPVFSIQRGNVLIEITYDGFREDKQNVKKNLAVYSENTLVLP